MAVRQFKATKKNLFVTWFAHYGRYAQKKFKKSCVKKSAYNNFSGMCRAKKIVAPVIFFFPLIAANGKISGVADFVNKIIKLPVAKTNKK